MGTISQGIFEREFAKETVFKDRNLVTPHYTPEVLPFRNEQITEISQNVALCLGGKKPDNLFIYGKTGTGKTSVARKVVQELLEFAGKRGARIDAAYVNCRNHNSKYRVLIKMVKDFYPEENFMGFSSAFIYEKLIDYVSEGNTLVVVLDEIDKTRDLDDLIYALTRANDELKKGSISVIGISNNLVFKDRLDPRTKSSLCEREMVFAPYNAEELREILTQRVELAFRHGVVEESAINLASGIAAQESGDARTAVMLLLRAGEIADSKGGDNVTDEEVKKAKRKVEEEIIYNMVSTLPEQQQMVIYAIADLTLDGKPVRKVTGAVEEGLLYSGGVYERYAKLAKKYGKSSVSARWYRDYIKELEMYGLILTSASGKGVKGQTTLIKLATDAKKIRDMLGKEFGA
ncbi:MAG: orc1/cdc6 family replication initiation protein [Candidatus Diapherotrites archaeon]|nr:orc1/cdc6 family replication initiation protein [Candidatus Micrarchaeota archaeon]MBU1939851.1 orc1/cdc6 family replication initiation protein [Candidatus Micrarchaeota archaeon]